MSRKIISIDFIRPDVFVASVERKGFTFTPGQHVTLGLTGAGINREYSIYSGTQEEHLRFLIKIHEGSDSAENMAAAKPGTPVVLAGRYGAFHLPEDMPADTPVLFLAAGVGVSPFHCIATSVPNLNYHVVHGVREMADAYGREDFDQKRHTVCCSRSNDGDFNGRVTAWLKCNEIPGNAMVMICGPATMVAETYEGVRGQGISSDQILTEVFY